MYRNILIAAASIAIVALGAATSTEAGQKAGAKAGHKANHARHMASASRACPLDIFSHMRSSRAEKPARATKAKRIAKPSVMKKERVARHVLPNKGKAPKLKA